MTHLVRFKKSTEYIRFDAPALKLSGNAFLPSTALVSLLQHSGNEAKPIVSPGDWIHEGQLLARGKDSTSAHVHSPVPGIIQEFRKTPMPNGGIETAAVIRLSGAFDILGKKEENYPWRSSPESEILRVLEDKGLINTFETPIPLVPQLRKSKENGKPTLAIRLFDNDPTCQLDSFLVHNGLERILEGAALIAHGIDANNICLVYTEKRWFGPDEKTLADIFSGRNVITIRTSNRYPSGNTGQFVNLMQSVLPENKLSSFVFIDPVTAYSAYEAVVKNKPILNRLVVITGPALYNPAVLNVRIGTPIGDLIEECGGFRSDPSRIIVNGLLTGYAVYDLDTPVTKYTKSLHIMDSDACRSYSVRDCIHCGRCLHVCPASIDPQRVVIGIEKEKFTQKLADSITACQYCGCCAIVCPSRIPLHHIIREAAARLKGAENEGE